MIISGLLLGSPGNKSHLDAGSVEQRKGYYMGEGGGFPRVRTKMSSKVRKSNDARSYSPRNNWKSSSR
jgi:hypothetical protein